MQVVTNIAKGNKYGTCNMMGCGRVISLIYNNVNERYYCCKCAMEINKRNPEFKKYYGRDVCEYDGDKKELKKKDIMGVTDNTMRLIGAKQSIGTRRLG